MEPIFDEQDEEACAAVPNTSMWAQLRSWPRALLDFLLPPRCAGCGAQVVEPTALCPACWGKMHFIERPFCERLALPFEMDHGDGAVSPAALADPPPWTQARAAVLYDGLGGQLVRALKYADRHDVVPVMAHLTVRAGRDILAQADFIIPIPLHGQRLRQRRFNQSALLAQRIGRMVGVPVMNNGLIRKRATLPQASLSRMARARNVAGAFMVSASVQARIKGRVIVLVDDVLTSGATLASATRALKRGGAARVDVLVFARTGETMVGGSAE